LIRINTRRAMLDSRWSRVGHPQPCRRCSPERAGPRRRAVV